MDTSNSASDPIPIYSKHTFLTCRSPTDSFYLCRILHDVYDETKPVRIQWYSFVDQNQNENNIDENTRFKLSHDDVLDIHTVLTEIPSVVTHPHHRISLKKKDIIRTHRLLKESIKAETSQTTEETTANQLTKRKASDERPAARK